jgi:hypothetical protein
VESLFYSALFVPGFAVPVLVFSALLSFADPAGLCFADLVFPVDLFVLSDPSDLCSVLYFALASF